MLLDSSFFESATEASVDAPESKDETLAQRRARGAVEATDNQKEAAELLAYWAKNDPRLYEELMDGALYHRCYSYVGSFVRTSRAEAIERAKTNRAEYIERTEAHAKRLNAKAAGILETWRMRSGKPLGEATRDEVEGDAYNYKLLGEDMLSKSRFLYAIAQALGKERVCERFTSEQVEKLLCEC